MNEVDYFVFGWDWRRDGDGDFFEHFSPLFRSRVQAECSRSARLFTRWARMGGMIVKLVSNRNNNPYVQLMKRA